MKILLVNDNGNNCGGTEKYLFNLITLLKKNHQVKLFTSSSPGANSDYHFTNKKNKIRIYSDQIFNPSSLRKMKEVLKMFKPDIVHVHNIDKKLSASIMPLFKDIPTVLTIHDLDLIYPGAEYSIIHDCKLHNGRYCSKCTTLKSYIFFRLKNWIRLPMIRDNIDLFIAPSNYILNKASDNIGIKNIIKINHGINLHAYESPGNSEQLLFVGRLEKTKGVYPLIYAFKEINKQYPNSSLVIAGDGREMANLVCLVKRLNLKNVKFTGWLGDEEIANLYKRASIIIVPSICEESFGLVGLEAMSVGRPVIASRVGGIPEWFDDGETGYLVDAGNPEQIAEKAIQLLSNKNQLEQMGKNARKKAEQFSIEKHIIEISKIYQRVIKEYKTKQTS